MRFGDNFISSQHPPWATSYIDYIRLKQLIYPLFDLRYAAEESINYIIDSPLNDLSSPRHLPDIQTSAEFQKELNNEVQKALLFLLGSLGEIASGLSELSEEFITLSANVQLQLSSNELLEQIHALRMKFIDRVGSKLLLLLEFVELNVEAITKIVKKHDKAVARWEASSGDHYGDEQHRYQRLRTQYLPRFAVHSTNANIRCLFLIAADAGDTNNNSKDISTFGGWNALQFNLEKSLEQLFSWERDLLPRQNRVRSGTSGNLASLQGDEQDAGFSPLSHRSLSFGFNLASLSSPSKQKQSSEAPFFEPMLYRIQSTRKRLGQSTNRYNRMVYAHEMLGNDLNDNNQSQIKTRFGSIENMQKLRSQSIGADPDVRPPSAIVSQLSKFLNLASSALYMCNYNVTTPTSGLYAKLLGFDEAHAGLIIGMTPAAVIVSSLLYSWWSSYSYKKALIFASSCCAIGNLIYAFALPCNSLTMVLVGRLMTGFGSARTINRRYIADYYNLEERTAGMADFVSASALGMAVGPALAALLSYVAPAGGHHAGRWWTVETAPGYVMFFFWCLYLVANIIFFEEPDRVQQTSAKEEKAATSDERAPLKSNTGINIDEAPRTKTAKRSFSLGGVPVFISLLLLVLLKAVLEGLTSSTPTVSRYYFGWDVNLCGTYLAILASLMIPANYVVATVSRRFDDREIILAMLVMMGVGIAGFVTYAGSDGETSFICFSLIIFISCNALEGPTMGLLSKVIPKSLRAGIFNAGWLATEAGTIGRVFGDFWLSGAAHKGIGNLVVALFGPLITLVIGSTVVTLWNYSQLQPRYDDEEDDD